MATLLVKCVAAVAVAALCLLLFFLIVNGRAYRQSRGTVAVREPGMRLLGAPGPAAERAKKDVDFALLSQAAYNVFEKREDPPCGKGDCMDAEATLQDLGWTRWSDFPDAGLQEEFKRYNLRVEVWENPSRNAVAVTFGGTEPGKWRDWQANFRWFIPYHDDEYSEIVKKLGPAFVAEYVKRSHTPEDVFLSGAKVFATGHSLGGGLAQQFAYSLPIASGVPRVHKVFAFDPSPVTGFLSVDKALREENEKGLKIDRIYERGEILAMLRSITSFVHLPSAKDPTVRQLRYQLFSRQPLAGHSIKELAAMLYKVSR